MFHEVEEIRQECGQILYRSKPPKPKLTKENFDSICRLNENRNILILKVNKGNAPVIMDSSDYDSKMLDLLSTSTYKPLAKNPINSITTLVTKVIKSSSLDPTIQKHLLPHNHQTPRIYEQPKIHKKGIPLGPIVSAIRAPTQALSRFLANKLQTFVGKTSSFIKDSTDFIQKTQDFHLNEDDLMVSFDVVSLFTKIPIPEALTLLSKLVYPETMNLIKICLSSTFFTFKEVCYEQIEGTTMGSSLSPVVANILIEHFESLALSNFHLKPKCWFCFVDDTLVIWPHGHSNLILFFNQS